MANSLTRLLLICVAFTLQACAGLLTEDTRAVAETEHAACIADGHEWPSAAYERCRYRLAERKHRRDWENLRLIAPRRPDQTLGPAPEVYRPLPRAGFTCTERRDDHGARWIECTT